MCAGSPGQDSGSLTSLCSNNWELGPAAQQILGKCLEKQGTAKGPHRGAPPDAAVTAGEGSQPWVPSQPEPLTTGGQASEPPPFLSLRIRRLERPGGSSEPGTQQAQAHGPPESAQVSSPRSLTSSPSHQRVPRRDDSRTAEQSC